MTMRWYAVHVYSNCENKIKEQIIQQAEKKGLSDKFEEILIPVEKRLTVKRGKKVESERNILPSYILMKMELTDETWHLVQDTPRVTGFIGSKNRPSPIPEEEAQHIISQANESAENPLSSFNFEIGERVIISEGAFKDNSGEITDVDTKNEKLTIDVTVFNKTTPVTTDFKSVQKIT